jgi:hypothetical protein
MLEDRIKILFKRRRDNKIRYSANKVYASRAELNHTNSNIFITLYLYNKQKSSIERYIRKVITLIKFKKRIVNNQKIRIPNHKNRLLHFLKNNFFIFKKWNMAFFKTINNVVRYLLVNLRKKYFKLYNIPTYSIRLLKKLFRLQKTLFASTKKINFNKSKFNSLNIKWRNLGLISLIGKLYNKKVEIDLVELKSIHLNSDVFSSAVALKLRDRKNKAVRILRKAILQMVRIPDLHTLITFDDNIEEMNKNNIIKTIKQQIVSGVRFEASGRLTRRLTAMRAVFKYRYAGSLKNIRSSFNNKSSTMLRGYVKSNSQYTLINSKTRNGTFGLKGWVSSHSILHTIINHIAIMIRKDLRRLILNFITKILLSKSKNYPICIILQDIIGKFNNLFTFYLKITDLFLCIISFIAKVRYPLVYNIYLSLKNEYICIIKGNDLKFKHIQLFIALGLLVGSVDYFYWVLVMVFSSRTKTYMYIRGLDIKFPLVWRFSCYLLDIIYALSLAICMGHIVNVLILPLIKKLIIFLKNIFNGILYMSGSDKNDPSIGGSDRKNPTPEPENPTDIGFPKENKNKGKDNKKKIHPFFGAQKENRILEDDNSFKANYDNFFGAIGKLNKKGDYGNKVYNLPKIMDKYRDYLSQTDKMELNDLVNKLPSGGEAPIDITVKEFWEKRLDANGSHWVDRQQIINIFYKNSKSIQINHLGGKKSLESKEFKQELELFYNQIRGDYDFKKSVILEQIKRNDSFQEQLKSMGWTVHKIFTDQLK